MYPYPSWSALELSREAKVDGYPSFPTEHRELGLGGLHGPVVIGARGILNKVCDLCGAEQVPTELEEMFDIIL